MAGAVLALVPDRYLPDGQGVNVEGTFDGRPVEIQWPRQRAAPDSFALVLEKGLCGMFNSMLPAQFRGAGRRGAKPQFHPMKNATWTETLLASRASFLSLTQSAEEWTQGRHRIWASLAESLQRR